MNKKNQILDELNRSILKFQKRHSDLSQLSRKYSFYRLGIFSAGLAGILISFFFINETAVWVLAALTLIVFGITAAYHNKLNYGLKKNGIWIKIKEAQRARINIDWNNIPPAAFTIPDMRHPFEADLNITGEYSLHRLIDNSVSHQGSLVLKNWLTSDLPVIEDILKRQELVKEIKPLHKFRNKLILFSRLASPEKLDSEKFIKWLKGDNHIQKLKKILPVSWILILLNFVFLLLFIFGVTGPLFTIVLLIYAAVYFFNLNLVRDSYEKAMHTEAELGKFYSILNFLETYSYGRRSKLKEFCLPLLDPKNNPGRHFKKIKNLITLLSFQKNPLTALLLNLIMPWDLYFTLKLEKEKEELAVSLKGWLETWHELEALASIAEFAYLNSEYSFPEIINDQADEVLSLGQAAHPLIPYTSNIKNDFEIKGLGETIIITGSNMSGKSTFLKTLGCNLLLAYAGGPVNAFEFKTRLFRIFTCIKVDDSVTDGISYFYAEVKRLKSLLDKLETQAELPLFFLIDEIFRGTNNIERLTGSRSYIKALAGKNGTGLISTHDLELVKLEQEIPQILNYHFREEAEGNRMTFDYTLRKGPSPTTNALKIMKLEGLPVD